MEDVNTTVQISLEVTIAHVLKVMHYIWMDIYAMVRVNNSMCHFIHNCIAFIDIDECEEGLHMCASNATCTNTEGGYNCSCDTGYHGDGFNCNSK